MTRQRPRLFTWSLAACSALVIASVVTGCSSAPKETTAEGTENTTLTVGASPENPITHGIVTYVADEIAADHGITIKVEDVADVRQQNDSVNSGDLDASVGQNAPYLEVQKKEGGYDLSAVQPVYLFRLGGYSTKHSSVAELPEGAKVGIHTDPANLAQDLVLLSHQGLIELDPHVEPAQLTLDDVTSNPKRLDWQLLSGAQIVRTLDELDLGLVYLYVTEAAGVSHDHALFEETAQPQYASQLIVRTSRKDDPAIEKLIAAFADTRVGEKISADYSVGAAPAR